MTRTELLELAATLARNEIPFVRAVVVRRQAASSAQTGNQALITASGEFHGWLGGSCTRPTVVREAEQALADGRPRLLVLTPDPSSEQRPGVDAFAMACHSGGSVEIYLEPVLPAARLLVFGQSPIARALLALGQAMGYVCRGVEPQAARSVPAIATPSPPCFVVVATMGEGDEEAVLAALAMRPAYLGLVASAKRFARMRELLLGQGASAAQLDQIRCPAGLHIGAREPQEIALSILAEIVERQRATPTAAVVEPPPVATTATTALDPICGMTVDIATARHRAEHAGQQWYFCGAGCRQRFLAEPARYATRASA
jgi:xanthine dehydrogenase accessory factor